MSSMTDENGYEILQHSTFPKVSFFLSQGDDIWKLFNQFILAIVFFNNSLHQINKFFISNLIKFWGILVALSANMLDQFLII